VRDGADDAPDGLLEALTVARSRPSWRPLVRRKDSRTLRRSRRGNRIGRETAAAEVASAPRTLAVVRATRMRQEPGRTFSRWATREVCGAGATRAAAKPAKASGVMRAAANSLAAAADAGRADRRRAVCNRTYAVREYLKISRGVLTGRWRIRRLGRDGRRPT